MRISANIPEIFSDANVIDIDFSHWSHCIDFCVIAEQIPSYAADGSPAVYLVRFAEVTEFNCKFAHYDKPGPHSGNRQMRVHQAILTQKADQVLCELSYVSGDPSLRIACGSIESFTVSPEELHKRYPGWNRAGEGFLRRGIRGDSPSAP